MTDFSLRQIDNRPTVRSYRIVHLHCPRGKVETHYYPVTGGRKAIVIVGGIGERQESPAANLYPNLGEDMQHRRVPALRVKNRVPADLAETLYDLRLSLRFLETEGRNQVAVVGFGLGAAAALKAALVEPTVTALAMLSTAHIGDDPVHELDARCKVLMIHGGRDAVMPMHTAKTLYDRMSDPKELLLLPRNTHTLHENSTEVHLRLRDWLNGWIRS